MNSLEKWILIIVAFIVFIVVLYFLNKQLTIINMPGFQKTVLLFAIIILIGLLVFIGVSLKKKETQDWPPVIGDCPDYWVDTSGNGGNCVNVLNLGTCPSSKANTPLNVNFSTSNYQGSNGLCNKYNYAQQCGITWDGITYGGSSTNPCNT
jgi:energy-coupling factor transporter transmembrane protein EcfT